MTERGPEEQRAPEGPWADIRSCLYLAIMVIGVIVVFGVLFWLGAP